MLAVCMCPTWMGSIGTCGWWPALLGIALRGLFPHSFPGSKEHYLWLPGWGPHSVLPTIPAFAEFGIPGVWEEGNQGQGFSESVTTNSSVEHGWGAGKHKTGVGRIWMHRPWSHVVGWTSSIAALLHSVGWGTTRIASGPPLLPFSPTWCLAIPLQPSDWHCDAALPPQLQGVTQAHHCNTGPPANATRQHTRYIHTYVCMYEHGSLPPLQSYAPVTHVCTLVTMHTFKHAHAHACTAHTHMPMHKHLIVAYPCEDVCQLTSWALYVSNGL